MFLEEIPDLTAAINLKKLDIGGCANLVKVHESVGSLSKLVEFYLSSNIKGFEQFPSYLKLKSLKTLFSYRCRIDEWCPQFSEEMDSLEVLLIDDSTVINQLSPTIGYLTSLRELLIKNCMELKTLPSTIYRLSNLTYLGIFSSDLSIFPSLNDHSSPSLFPYLTSIRLFDCKITNLDFLETMVHVAPSLEELDLSENNFCRLPSCIINFKSLKYIYTIGCKLLEEIPKVPKGVVIMNASGCVSLVKFPDNILDCISCDDNMESRGDEVFRRLILMNCDIPDWCKYKSMNNSIEFIFPADCLSSKSRVFACAKFEVNIGDGEPNFICSVFINDTKILACEMLSSIDEITPPLDATQTPTPTGEYLSMVVLGSCLYPDPYSLVDVDRYPYVVYHYPFGDIMYGSGKVDLNQLCCRMKSSRGILDKVEVLFEVPQEFKDAISIKMCGVHVIVEE